MIIDLSYFNRVTSWPKVKASVEAVIIRLGYRGYGKTGTIVYDKKYKTFRTACEKYGIPFSLYFFPASTTAAEALEEADFIIAACKGMTFPLPVFLDSELAEPHGRGRADKLSVEQRTLILKLIVDTCQGAGIPMGIYASTSWLNNRLDMSRLPYSVWVAQYARSCKYKGEYMLWQYTSTAVIPGISGSVDASKKHSQAAAAQPQKKTVDAIAAEVIAGKWGNGADRVARLKAAGYDPATVQKRVNQLV